MTKDNEIATFKGELEYYRNHNTFPITLLSKRIFNIYRHINIQVVLSKTCQFKCPFCIERDQITPVINESSFSILNLVLERYYDRGMSPRISITGGEPTLFPRRLREAIQTCKRWAIHDSRININTNGGNPKVLEESMFKNIRVNLSRHHYCETKVAEIFGRKSPIKYPIDSNTTLQCVLMKGYIDSVAEMKRYMDFYIGMGARTFSFRGMSTLDADKRYEQEVNFTNAHSVDFFSIVNEMFADRDIDFFEQKIGDHYYYEYFAYKGKMIRMTYSNFDFLRKVEAEERVKGDWYSRATIISPSGNLYAGWAYDINKIA